MGTFFLTAVDTEHLDIHGSRDPLGLVPVWGTFGRKVVENLTTASNSARGFTTLLLGLYFAERVSESESDRHATRLATFLKFEQLAGFARYICNDDANFRGITQVKRRWEEGNGRRITIGAAQKLQILSNQKTYGLWGLFITPAIDSGLVIRKDLSLTPIAREIIEDYYLPAFRHGGIDQASQLLGILERERRDLEPVGKHERLFRSLAEVLRPKFDNKERAFYHEHLVLGGDEAQKRGWQPRFSDLMDDTLEPGEPFDHASLCAVVDSIRKPADAPLREHLVRIRDLEALLVASANLFAFLQQRENAKISDTVTELRKAWGKGLKHLRPNALEEMQPDIDAVFGDAAAGARFVQLGSSLRKGDFEAAIDQVLDHNRFMMSARNGSQPWIQRVAGKLDVRYRDGTPTVLATPTELATAWQSTFYINSMKYVADQLRGAA
jgi:hypothetical protein